jgi:DNA (cytosine-5)-methyltransferase 1
MRSPQLRASFESSELVVDSFAGGGGASTGIEWALGRPVDIAINHDAEAIRMHALNHPETKHYQNDIWAVDPKEACAGRKVAALWSSPACTHFSRAKGTSSSLNAEIRDLAWVIVRWAAEVRPRAIFCENVSEWSSWGPLLENGRPDPALAGSTWREWLGKLSDLGYEVQFRELVAADYGAPTTRKRLYVIARCDKQPIIWPESTHGKGRRYSWREAHEIMEWQAACPSIFERKRPLAEATERRIARGIDRYVINNAEPFIVPVRHSGDSRCYSMREPLRTVTAAHRGEFAYVEPFIVRHGHYSTITGAGLREGCGAGTFRGQPLSAPLATVCATNDKHIVAPIITKHYGSPNRADGKGGVVIGHEVTRPLGSVTARDHHSLTAAFMTKFYGTSTGASMREPLPTVTSGGGKGGGHLAEVRAFLLRYNGTGIGSDLQLPLPTITAKPRFGVVTVQGEDYEISDIGMRMLLPRELYRAQGFHDTYKIDGFTKETQIRLCGNSVSPNVARAIVAANLLGERAEAA